MVTGSLQAGVGAGGLRLGASQTEVRGILGAPAKVVDELPLSYLYAYPGEGVEIDFAVPHGRAAGLFFYGHDWNGLGHAAVQTAEGIGFATRREEVVARLGLPAGSDDAYVLDRRFHTAWLYYPTGIQFHFDADGRMVIIAICPPRRG